MGIDSPGVSRFYRIKINSLADGVQATATNELETWYGSTLGNVKSTSDAVQSEPHSFQVRVVSPDALIQGGRVRLDLLVKQ